MAKKVTPQDIWDNLSWWGRVRTHLAADYRAVVWKAKIETLTNERDELLDEVLAVQTGSEYQRGYDTGSLSRIKYDIGRAGAWLQEHGGWDTADVEELYEAIRQTFIHEENVKIQNVLQAAINWAADDGSGGVEIDGQYYAIEDLCEALAEAVKALDNTAEESDEDRDIRFTPSNDGLWGKGNWVRCATCPPDANGRQPYHHKDAHISTADTFTKGHGDRLAESLIDDAWSANTPKDLPLPRHTDDCGLDNNHPGACRPYVLTADTEDRGVDANIAEYQADLRSERRVRARVEARHTNLIASLWKWDAEWLCNHPTTSAMRRSFARLLDDPDAAEMSTEDQP